MVNTVCGYRDTIGITGFLCKSYISTPTSLMSGAYHILSPTGGGVGVRYASAATVIYTGLSASNTVIPY